MKPTNRVGCRGTYRFLQKQKRDCGGSPRRFCLPAERSSGRELLDEPGDQLTHPEKRQVSNGDSHHDLPHLESLLLGLDTRLVGLGAALGPRSLGHGCGRCSLFLEPSCDCGSLSFHLGAEDLLRLSTHGALHLSVC